MGRSKAKPVRKAAEPASAESDVLFCNTSDSAAASSRERLLEMELARDIDDGHLSYSTGRPNTMASRAYRASRVVSFLDEDDEMSTSISGSSSAATNVQTPQGSPRRSKPKSRSKRRKRVRFHGSVDESVDSDGSLMAPGEPDKSVSVTVIANPELRILRRQLLLEEQLAAGQQSLYGGDEMTGTILEFRGWDETPFQAGSDEMYPVWSFLLPDTCIQLEANGTEEEAPLTLRTRLSIRDIWKHYKIPGYDSQEFMEALNVCVIENPLFRLDLLSRKPDGKPVIVTSDVSAPTTAASVVLTGFLTAHAFDVCHPGRLPLKRHRSSKQFHVPQSLIYVLSALLPGVNDNGTLTKSGRGKITQLSREPITAKRVYGLTDNQQLKAALGHKDTPHKALAISGLIPKLRGYQELAVRWMLKREESSIGCGNEWELAWIVLASQVSETGLRSAMIVPLPEWKCSTCKPSEPIFFFSPFSGWLAKSYQHAKEMTVDKVESKAFVPDRGGILAESMGLGKSVEVLACILANPRDMPTDTNVAEPGPPAMRRLDFESASISECLDDYQNTNESDSEQAKVGVVGEMNEFGDADSSDDDCVSVEDSAISKKISSSPSSVVPAPNAGTLTERFVEDDVIGSCICGSLVCFSTSRKSDRIIICEACEEPMHIKCSSFNSETELFENYERVRYRQILTNKTIDAFLCDESHCPCCVTSTGQAVSTRATLIVTPAAILDQWEREIYRHARTRSGEQLKIVKYDGIKSSHKPESMKLLHARILADADIVLMTFDALRADLDHSDENKFVTGNDESSKLRKRKRYRVVPSPLMSIDWWRVCLDEAQRVETPTARSAQMALKLKAQIRWCVSGTPVGRGKLEDLYGLMLFLKIRPFSDKQWFDRCLNPSYAGVDGRIQHLLRDVFWRSTKKYDLVREQMGVPEQVEQKVFLRPSSIEKHFYNRQVSFSVSTG